MRLRRIWQVFKYGIKDAKFICSSSDAPRSSLFVLIDILQCFFRYGVWSNQYKNAHIYLLSGDEKVNACRKLGEESIKREQWFKTFLDDRSFFIKYGNVKYERLSLRSKRNKAYTKRFNAGKNLFVEFDVNISRQHYLDGTISIGDDVLLAKHVFIDYSGQVVLRDGVKISDGVVIESHSHFIDKTDGSAIPGHLIIDDHVKIYTRAYIADTCHQIGRHARIGAGCYVRNNIPPYAIVMGNPAKIVGFVATPKELIEFEKENYPESERIPIEILEKNYNKYFKDRIKEIKEFVKQ